ncbi:MAG TPA: hypothetical protein VHA13_03715 [Gammaproteobacteria bacterium]|nr:hypothetical protein [Gammaproteobacteria bacterium]
MKLILKGCLVILAIIFLSSCETPQPDQPTVTNNESATADSDQSQASSDDQVVNVTAPEAGAGESQSVQSPAGASAAKTVAPLTQ